jgi:hypothetical protein
MVVCACPRGPEPERGVLLEYATTAPVREVVERRLARAQLSARVTEGDGTLTLRLPEATDPVRVERLLARRGAFVLCGEQLEDQRRWCTLASAPAVRARPLDADAGCVLEDAVIGPRVLLKPYSIVSRSEVRAGAQIGPFAHIRPESVVEEDAHVGNFVELKKTRLGPGAKANHLAYLGDGVIGTCLFVAASSTNDNRVIQCTAYGRNRSGVDSAFTPPAK